MSFDQDPRDAHQRFLLYHPESESLFEVWSEAERDNIIDGEPLCEDVTGVAALEDRFRKKKVSV